VGEYTRQPVVGQSGIVDVTIAPDAEPGPREIRLVTPAGITNPMTFHVSQFPEASRPPRGTWILPILGKEEGAEPKRPPEEIEMSVTLPCVVNGQIAAGAVDHYRFEAKQGQRLVISTYARHLLPYIADAVPGWFQPVITLYDAEGREVAYSDDYRFKPDPVLYYEVPEDGQYVLTISDALFRGREDFVYRITIAERPYLTSIFPLGGRVGEPLVAEMQGWNLEGAQLSMPPTGSEPGIYHRHRLECWRRLQSSAVRGRYVAGNDGTRAQQRTALKPCPSNCRSSSTGGSAIPVTGILSGSTDARARPSWPKSRLAAWIRPWTRCSR
jgi:hypothetical protein